MRSLALALGGLLLFVHAASAQTTPAPPAEPPSAAEAKEKDKGARRPQVRTYSTVTVIDDPAKAPPLPIPRREAEPPREVRRPNEASGAGEPSREERRGATGANDAAKERAAVRELRDHLRSERAERRDQPDKRPEADRPAPRAPEARAKDRPDPRERQNERAQRRERAIERLRLRKE